MPSAHHAVAALLFAAMAFSSCECKKDPAPVEESAFPERKVGFHVDKIVPTPIERLDPVERDEPELAEEEEPPRDVPGLPDDFPSEVPIYEGSTLSQVQGLANNAHNVVFTTEAPVPDVNRYYHDHMLAKGWQVTQQFERGNHAFATFKKGDTLMNLTIAEDASNPGKQVIAIMYEEVQPLPFDEF